MASIRSFVLIIGLVVLPTSVASARSAWNTGTPLLGVTLSDDPDGVRRMTVVGPHAAAILRDGTIISKMHNNGWFAYFVVKWNDTIADCLVTLGSIECHYPIGFVDEK